MFRKLILLATIITLLSCVICENKYSRAANENGKDSINFRTLEKPFRMNKLNLVWIKAQQVKFYKYIFRGY